MSSQAPLQPQSQASILSSPFLTLSVLDTALRAEVDPTIRVQLLGAKVHLLDKARSDSSTSSFSTPTPAPSGASSSTTSTPSTPTASAGIPLSAGAGIVHGAVLAQSNPGRASPRHRIRPDPTSLLNARILLADAYLSIVPPNLHAAEGECGAVEGECKRLMKVAKRLDRRELAPSGEMEDDKVGGEEKRPDWLDDIPRLRVRALRILARVEKGLGRDGRAERTRKLADELAANDKDRR